MPRKDLQPSKVLAPISVRDLGSSTVTRAVQPLKVPSSVLTLDGILTVASEVQPWNVPTSEVTFLESVTLVNDEQP